MEEKEEVKEGRGWVREIYNIQYVEKEWGKRGRVKVKSKEREGIV